MGGWVKRAITAPARCTKAANRAFQGKTAIAQPGPADQPRSIPMKTKPFLLATAGSTVDGRMITEAEISEMASSYNPETYGARLNIEHIRGISGQAPFKAYGDVVEVSEGEVEVDLNGKKEKRKALFGVFEITADAKALNEANQKVYPSIEIIPDFGGKGFAYLGGVALTDSPAAIATERLKFNRSLPGSLNLSLDTAAALVADETDATTGSNALLAGIGAMFDKFSATFAPKTEPKADDKPKTDPAAATLDFAAMKPLFEDLGKTLAASQEANRAEFNSQIDALTVQIKKLEAERENTPAATFRARPLAGGGSSTTAAEQVVF